MEKTQEAVSIKKIIAFVLARGMPAAINFLAMSFYAHNLAPAAYGEYSLSLFWSTLLSALLFSWLQSAMQRFFEENKNNLNVLLHTISKTFFIISLIILIISVPVYFWLHELLFYIMVLTIGQSFFQLCLQLMVIQVQARKYAIISATNAVLSFLLAFIFIKLGWGALGIVMAMALSNIITVAKVYLGNWRFSTKPAFSSAIFKKSFFYGYPLSISMIVGVMTYGLDRAVLGYFCSKTSVGLYALPFDLANQSITLLFMSFQLYLYPLALRSLYSNGKEGAQKCLQVNGRIFLTIILPSMLVLIYFPSWIGQIVTGAQYRSAFAEILPLIAVGAVLRGFKAYYFDLAFQLSSKTLIQVYMDGFILAVNFGLNLLIIPKYSYVGAAYVSVFSSIVGILLSWFLGRSIFKVPALISFKNCKIFGCAIIMALLFNKVNSLENWYYVIFFSIMIVGTYFLLAFLPIKKFLFSKKELSRAAG